MLKEIYKFAYVLAVVSVMSGCAVSEDPRERSTLDVVIGSTKVPQHMYDKLDRLNNQITVLDDELLLSYGDIGRLAQTVEKLQIPQNELAALKREVADIEVRVSRLQEQNRQSKEEEQRLKAQLDANELEKEEVQARLDDIDKDIKNTELQLAAFKLHVTNMLKNSQRNLGD